MSAFKTIICSINLIERSEDIVYYTRELAKQNDAKVYVVHSLPSLDHLRSYIEGTGMADSLIENAEKKAKEFLVDFIAKNFEGITTEPVVTVGTAANDLLKLADDYCADLIVMGSLSTKGMLSFLNPKQSETVIGRTRVPVMVVPNDLDMDCTPNFD